MATRPRAVRVYKHPDARVQSALNELYLAAQNRKLRIEDLNLDNLAFRLGAIFREGQITVLERLRTGDEFFEKIRIGALSSLESVLTSLATTNTDPAMLLVQGGSQPVVEARATNGGVGVLAVATSAVAGTPILAEQQKSGTSSPCIACDSLGTIDLQGTDSNWKVESAGDCNFGGGYREKLDGWGRVGLVGGLTNSRLERYAQSSEWRDSIMPRAGSITGLSARYSAALTNGTITIKVFKNGTDTGVSMSFSNPDQVGTGTFAKDGTTFAAGDRLDLRVTTSGVMSPGSGNLRADLEVET